MFSSVGRVGRLSLRIAMLAALLAASGCIMARPALTTIAPAPRSLGANDVEFRSASGSTIHAWLARGRAGLGAILLLHGVGANRTSMLARAEYFHRAGYTVLAPDFQAHGESPGEHITFGALESLDAEAAVRFLRSAAPGERIGVIGVSMGGAAAVLATPPLRADAFVLESVYPTIDEALTDRLNVWLGPFRFLTPSVAPALMKIVGSDIGVDDRELRPIDHIGALHAPVLVLAGTDDQYTTISESVQLYSHARDPKSFWAVPGAEHEDIYDYAPRDYERIVGGFLARALRGVGPAGVSKTVAVER